MSRRPTRRIAISVWTSMAIGLLACALASSVTASAGCGATGRYYGEGTSGTGSQGTNTIVWTPNNWSVTPTNSGNFTAVAAWISSVSNQSKAMEGGYGSGYFQGDGTWTNGLLPYYTLNGGGPPSSEQHGDFLAANSRYDLTVVQGANGLGRIEVGYNTGQYVIWGNLNYVVGSDGLNSSQAEVKDSNTNTWMGNGPSTVAPYQRTYNYWTPDRVNFYQWSYLTACGDYPYHAAQINQYTYEEGGPH